MGFLKKRWAGVVGLAVMCGLGWWWWRTWVNPVCEYNYRLTVEVETPNGIKIGTSVIQRRREGFRYVIGFGERDYKTVTGEALYVDLGEGKNLFVTLTNDASGRQGDGTLNGALDAATLPEKILGLQFGPMDESEECAAARALIGKPPLKVPPDNLPTIVTFQNINDPTTMKVADPRKLSADLGAQYHLNAATVEVVDAPVTIGLLRILTWLDEFQGKHAFDGTEFVAPDAPASSHLGYRSFKLDDT